MCYQNICVVKVSAHLMTLFSSLCLFVKRPRQTRDPAHALCFSQHDLNKGIESILKAAKDIPLWQHAEMQKQQQKIEVEAAKKMGEDPKMTKTQPQKPLYLQVT